LKLFRAYKYKLYPTKTQYAWLEKNLEDQRILYNAALEERISAYNHGVFLSLREQKNHLTQWRKDDIEARNTLRRIQTWTLCKLDSAYKSFVSHRQAGNKLSRRPRFRSKDRWSSFGIENGDYVYFNFEGSSLKTLTMPGKLRFNKHRELPVGNKINNIIFKKYSKGWQVVIGFSYEIGLRLNLFPEVGVDLGLTNIVTLSDGIKIPNPRVLNKHLKKLKSKQRLVSRAKKGSNNRKKKIKELQKVYIKIVNTRNTFSHAVSRYLVNNYSLVAFEDLKVSKMNDRRFTRSNRDASWTSIRNQVRYKVQDTGGEYIEVEARGTTKECSCCGVLTSKEIWNRVHNCSHCGLILDRDVNAAINVLSRAAASPGVFNLDCRDAA